MTNPLSVLILAVFGLILGSFINVVALRDNKRKTILYGRSHCPHCRHTLAWYDLFPVLSFMSTLGRCRYCKKSVSWRYPLVEVVSAGVVVLVWTLGMEVYGGLAAAIGLTAAALLLMIVSLIDLQSFEVPIEYVVAAGVCGAGGLLLADTTSFTQVIRGLAIGSGILAVILYGWKAAFKQDGMGSGDLWIAGAVGAIVGYPVIMVSLMAAVMTGAIIGSLLALMSKKGLQSPIPFGPFLSAGLLVGLLWGQSIVQWYILGL